MQVNNENVMWEHNLLHTDSSVHQHETQILDQEIIRDWYQGAVELPQRYNHLYRGTLED